MAFNGKVRPKCSIEECDKPNWCNNYCAMHYKRFIRHGDPNFINPKCNRDGGYKTRHKAYVKQWKKDNKKSYNAYLASRKHRVKQATPKWTNVKAIQQFYFNCPKGYHVDHIVPLNGRLVSGLHIINNLQYLPAIDNLKKSNKEI